MCASMLFVHLCKKRFAKDGYFAGAIDRPFATLNVV